MHYGERADVSALITNSSIDFMTTKDRRDGSPVGNNALSGEGRRQSAAVAASPHAKEDQAFVDSISEWNDDAATPHESTIQSRIASVFEMSVAVFGGDDKAREFLERPHMMLGNKTPIEVAAESDTGVDLVINIIGRAAYGGAV